MSSKVQAWRTAVIDPSGAKINSLVEVIQTCGWACAVPEPSVAKQTSSNTAMRRAGPISGCLWNFKEAATAQQRVGLRLPAAEGDIGLFRIARAAGRIDVVVQAPCHRRIEDVAGFLEGAERVGVHHLRP